MTSIPARCAELRADFIDRGETPLHVTFLDGIIQSSRRVGDRLFPYGWDGGDLADDLVRGMRMAEMFSITPEMQDLVTHAAASLPPQVLKRESLPSQSGFLYLPVPLWMEDIRGEMLPIRGIHWQERTVGREGEKAGPGMPDVMRGVTLNLFMLNGEDGDPAHASLSREERGRIMAHVPSLSLFHAMSVAFDQKVWDVDTSDMVGVDPEVRAAVGRQVMRSLHDGEVVRQENGRWLVRTSEGHVVKARADNVIQFMHAYLHFFGSTLSSLDRERMPRSMAKWMRRLGMPDSPITVVRLRRREPGQETGRGFSLSYRFVRRGHWRAQWYGSGEGRYQQHIWIAPTVVGDESLPLRVREVVNLVQF